MVRGTNFKTTALTIAGSDPTGGAGIQADLRVFRDLSVEGRSAITALTVQTKAGVRGVHPTAADLLTHQLSAAAHDHPLDVIKIGMIGTAANVLAIEFFLRSAKTNHIVIDPVLHSTNGVALLEPKGIHLFKELLIPYATLITPNLDEAQTLSGINVADIETMKHSAKIIYDDACKYGAASHPFYILVKGGHLTGDPTDLLFDGKHYISFEGKRLTDKNVHGTGCVLSSAIAAYLAKGKNMKDAVSLGREYLQGYILKSVEKP